MMSNIEESLTTKKGKEGEREAERERERERERGREREAEVCCFSGS